MQALLLGVASLCATHQQWHGDILKSGKLGQQIMELPDKSKLPAAEFRCIFFRKMTQFKLGEVYVTFGSAIKRSEYVEQGTFARTRLANNGQHLPDLHLQGQLLKEH